MQLTEPHPMKKICIPCENVLFKYWICTIPNHNDFQIPGINYILKFTAQETKVQKKFRTQRTRTI